MQMNLPGGKRKRILLIDENMPRAQELAEILTHHYDTDMLTQPPDTFLCERSGVFPYALVVCSLHSLEKIGVPVLSEVVKSHPRHPVAVALSWTLPRTDMPADLPEVISYPYRSGEVMRKVRTLLHQSSIDFTLESMIMRQRRELQFSKVSYRQKQMQMQALVQNLPCGIALLQVQDKALHTLYANHSVYRLLGQEDSIGEVSLNQALRECVLPDAYGRLYRMLAAMETQQTASQVFLLMRPDGTEIWCEIICRAVTQKDGGIVCFALLFDATEKTEKERMLAAKEQQYLLIAQASKDKLVSYDVERDIFRYPVVQGEKVWEESISRFYQDGLFKLGIHPEDLARFEETFFMLLGDKGNSCLDLRIKLFDGIYTWYKLDCVPIFRNGIVSQIVGRCQNIQQKMLDHISINDNVTGLLNLPAFQRRIQGEMETALPDKVYAISYSDINNFSYFNEAYSYDVGNQILYSFGIATNCLKGKYLVCRAHSDFFLIFHIGRSREAIVQDLHRLQAEFIRIVKEAFPKNEIQLSTGVCFLQKGDDIPHIIDGANIARKKAKTAQGKAMEIYTAQMRQERLMRQVVVGEFNHALKQKSFEIFLQPKFSLQHRNTVGAEALVRWRNKDGTYRNPDDFVQILEESGQIAKLDFYVLEMVLQVLSDWRARKMPLLPISINLSRVHVDNPTLVEDITGLVDKYGIPHTYIELETTESAMIENAGILLEKLRKVKKAGFLVNIDDFGTGYSSLNLLMDTAFDIVKVDKSLISDIETEKSKNNIKHLIQLINNTEKKIVFEGIETESQARLLLEFGCEVGQGFIFSQPVPVAEFEERYLQEIADRHI